MRIREYTIINNKCCRMPTRRKSCLSQYTRGAIVLKLRRRNESEYERLLRLANGRIRSAAKLASETPEQRLARLKSARERMANIRKRETAEQYAARLEKARLKRAAERQMSNEEYEKKMYRKYSNHVEEYLNLPVRDEDLLIYQKETRHTVIAINTNLSNSCKTEKQDTSKLIPVVKEEPTS